MAITYTTEGSVCGGCDHHHRSIRTAQECADRHLARIQRYNGRNAYSDRVVVRSDGRPLTEWEQDEIARATGWDGWE